MTNISVYELCMKTFHTKNVELVLITHVLATGDEPIERVTINEPYDTWQYRDYNVVMFEPTKKGHLVIHGYREV